MTVESETENVECRGDVLNVLILVSIAAALGIYLVATTVLISKDGVTYIELAKKISSEPLNVVKGLTFGYSFLIFACHKLAAAFSDSTSALTWTYSAQSVTLLCSVLALIPLYFIGKLLVGSRRSFWAVLILIILPYPAQFGSDALRDWPHILFLAAGFLLLLWGAERGKWWMFAAAGLAAGIGHIIRPECAQLVVYGVLWILIGLFVPKRSVNRPALLGALTALLLGFAIPAAPYMAVRGKILPEKLKTLIGDSAGWEPEKIQEPRIHGGHSVWTASSLPGKTVKAMGRLAGEMSDNLMYYFVPALVIGVWDRARRRSAASDIERFFIPAFVLLNVLMMIMLYDHWGYISRRHCLPLVVFLIFYVPAGMEMLAQWLEERLSRNPPQAGRHSQLCFFVLLAIGAGICMPKLLRPLGADKHGYREAAQWLKENTRQEDAVAVPDLRISFYAERKGIGYTTEIPEGTEYIVRIVRDEDEEALSGASAQKEFSARVEKRKKNEKRVVIYRMT
jgi:hypothetical protein